jgi:HEAT repeat protein
MVFHIVRNWVICVGLVGWGILGIAPHASEAQESKKGVDLLTRENYEKVAPGMSLEEVRAILGKSNSIHSKGSSRVHVYLGKKKEERIEISLKNSKVESKNSSFSWGDAPAVTAAPSAPVDKKPAMPAGDGLDQMFARIESDSSDRYGLILDFSFMPYEAKYSERITRALMVYWGGDNGDNLSAAHRSLKVWVHPCATEQLWAALENKPSDDKLKVSNTNHYFSAIKLLAKLKNKELLPKLCSVAKESWVVAALLPEVCEELGPELCVAGLLPEGGNPCKEVRNMMKKYVFASKELEKITPTLLKQITTDLQSENQLTRGAAAHSLRYVSSNKVDPATVESIAVLLEKLLNDSPAGTLEFYAEKDSLAEAKQFAPRDNLEELVEIKHPANQAIQALATWGSVKQEASVLALLKSDKDWIQKHALQTLSKIGSPQAITKLEELAAAETFRLPYVYSVYAETKAALQARHPAAVKK